MQFTANDPVYGFLRICDHSPFTRVFDDKFRARNSELNELPLLEREEKTIHLVGHCFNATVTIRKDENSCPWCSNLSKSEADQVLRSEISKDTLQSIMMVLGVISVVASVGTIILIACYLKDKRKFVPKTPKTVPIYICPKEYIGSCRESRTPKKPFEETKFATIGSSRQTFSTSGISSISSSSKFSYSDSISDIYEESCFRTISPSDHQTGFPV
ncbi:hypothetical protein WR25_18970 [Diploscapter pachys]|uniref:C2 domain-containing protein n=1 Tax=Diploscapter pachys TaxID=2018661 RepID=A0A2A2M053_9BILA|nr:hypothetical protein WR25_18970 [Diploscapter pachys]